MAYLVPASGVSVVSSIVDSYLNGIKAFQKVCEYLQCVPYEKLKQNQTTWVKIDTVKKKVDFV